MTTLSPQTPHLSTERRRFRRVSGDFQADIVIMTGDKAGDEVSGKILNICREGVALLIPAEIPVEGQLGLTLFVDGYDSLCVGTVVWKRPADAGILYGLKISHWSYLDPVLERQLPLHP